MNVKIPRSVSLRKKESPFFDESKMSALSNTYVCWLDVMGSESIMRRSVRIAANFVMKLHVAALEENHLYPDVEIIPVIDGMYLCSARQEPILTLVKRVLTRLAILFVHETDPLERFMVRGGLAFGPVCKGTGVSDCAPVLASNPDYCAGILLGIPVIQAYFDERQASPFGVHIHESARSFSPPGEKVLPQTHWKWWRGSHPTKFDKTLASCLKEALNQHYEWCMGHSTTIIYSTGRYEETQSAYGRVLLR